MRIETTAIDGVLLIWPKFHRDERGWFAETFVDKVLSAAGFSGTFVQDNHSCSVERGTVRGLHFQTPPFAQDKLVRCTRGRCLDVVVDIRRNSPTFGRHIAVELDGDAGAQVLAPAGMAHGFCTLEPDTEVVYKVSAYYSGANDKGLLWNDPALGIMWPAFAGAVVSDKDAKQPLLADLDLVF